MWFIFKIFFKDVIYLFLSRGEGREKERERNINVWLPLMHPPTGDLARNPGMCPDWQSNQWPFGSQAGTQSTEPHQPGLILFLCIHCNDSSLISDFLFFSFKDFIYSFLEGGEVREKERERNINVWLPPVHPPLGTWPVAQACALTGNWMGNPLVPRLALNPLSHISQGWFFFFLDYRLHFPASLHVL